MRGKSATTSFPRQAAGTATSCSSQRECTSRSLADAQLVPWRLAPAFHDPEVVRPQSDASGGVSGLVAG